LISPFRIDAGVVPPPAVVLFDDDELSLPHAATTSDMATAATAMRWCFIGIPLWIFGPPGLAPFVEMMWNSLGKFRDGP
jgi:hypothetical protein